MKYLESYKIITTNQINVGGIFGSKPGKIINHSFFNYIPYIINYLNSKKISYRLFTNDVNFLIILNDTHNIDLLPYEFKHMMHYFPLNDEHEHNISKRIGVDWFNTEISQITNRAWKEFQTKTTKDIVDLEEYIDNLLAINAAKKFNL